MTRKSYFQAWVLGVLVISFSPLVWAWQEPLVIDSPDAYPEKDRLTVMFSHATHEPVADCLKCHHDYAEGKNMLDEADLEETDPAIRCESCHAGNITVDLENAFHQQCIGCHHRMRIKGLATAPELCGECHRR